MSVHADVDFTLYERHVIDEAVRQLRSQAGIDITIHYDLDYENLKGLIALAQMKKMTRVGESAPAVGNVDARVKGHVYGWTILDRDIWIVWDRMSSERLMVHVVEHELLHALGVNHVSDPESVMYDQTDSNHMAVVLNESDRAAIRAAQR